MDSRIYRRQRRVFHCLVVKPYHPNDDEQFPGWAHAKPAPILIDDQKQWEVQISLISGRSAAGGNSWLDGKDTPLARIAGNLCKGLRMRRNWYRHRGRITCQGRNNLIVFRVILRFALLPLRLVLRNNMINRRWTKDSGNPIRLLIMIARRFSFLCCMFEIMFSFCFRGVTSMGSGWFQVSF